MRQEEMEAERQRAQMEQRRQEIGLTMGAGLGGAWSEMQREVPSALLMQQQREMVCICMFVII
jgi:hypothetical protein